MVGDSQGKDTVWSKYVGTLMSVSAHGQASCCVCGHDCYNYRDHLVNEIGSMHMSILLHREVCCMYVCMHVRTCVRFTVHVEVHVYILYVHT